MDRELRKYAKFFFAVMAVFFAILASAAACYLIAAAYKLLTG